MPTQHLEFDIPGDILIALNNNINELKMQMRIFTAMKLFEMGKLSLGKAAKLAGISYWNFSEILSENKISLANYPDEDLKKEISMLEDELL
ncbi:MAG: UPF0175 family protein [Candidatus Cloacimonetes bacterium]|nr:UPF0175 family protein [Candidatus Cloacimonadota bacterium]